MGNNDNVQLKTNITASDFQLSQGKTLIEVKHFQDKIKFLRKKLRIKMK